MKYHDFKIFKFSIISKKINRIRDGFSGIYKNIKTIPSYIADFCSSILKYTFSGINKSIQFILHDFLTIYRLTGFRRSVFKKVYKYLDIRKYDFSKINRKINLANYKQASIYFVVFMIFMGFVYVVIPKFYSYDKLKITKALCNNQNVECLIRGKIYYSFFPTPRIKIKDLIINNVLEKKNNLAKVENAAITISIKNLLAKEKHKFKKIKLNNFEINLSPKSTGANVFDSNQVNIEYLIQTIDYRSYFDFTRCVF